MTTVAPHSVGRIHYGPRGGAVHTKINVYMWKYTMLRCAVCFLSILLIFAMIGCLVLGLLYYSRLLIFDRGDSSQEDSWNDESSTSDVLVISRAPLEFNYNSSDVITTTWQTNLTSTMVNTTTTLITRLLNLTTLEPPVTIVAENTTAILDKE